MVEDREATAFHFNRGYEIGQRFVSSALSGEISPDAIRAEVPVYISLSMQGPSPEFILGRIYETTATDAFDRVVSKDANGAVLPVDRWVMDQDVRRVIAQALRDDANCPALASEAEQDR